VASPILVDGRVYCVEKGSQLTVFDLKTGKSTGKLDLGRDKELDGFAVVRQRRDYVDTGRRHDSFGRAGRVTPNRGPK
jgi:hypothetical protein